MDVKTIQKAILTLHERLINLYEAQPYINPTVTVDADRVSLYWYGVSISDTHRFSGETFEEAFCKANTYLNTRDPEREKTEAFLTHLAQSIEMAPPQIDTAPLTKFKEEVYACLPSPQH